MNALSLAPFQLGPEHCEIIAFVRENQPRTKTGPADTHLVTAFQGDAHLAIEGKHYIFHLGMQDHRYLGVSTHHDGAIGESVGADRSYEKAVDGRIYDWPIGGKGISG
jgi:hypothetical protein